ncbi:alpha/beta hydrolase [uncultured Draconibacterium sp.]|uniref:alpha/beta fold hydrolase n=1 Tax=uncultured Draconibacterium sp. TaxID=1573823 RepID=UPI0032162FFC
MKTNNTIYKSANGKIKVLEFYNSILKDWTTPCREHQIITTYGSTFVLESGNKSLPKIVLLHGSGSNSAMWKADVAEYSKNFHVFAVDVIGECGNSAENRPHFKDKHYSDWLNEVFEKLKINQASIIGCSLGAWIATEFAVYFPQKTEKLVLIAAAGITQLKLPSVLLITVTSAFGEWGFNKINKMIYGDLDIDKTALQFVSLVQKHFIPRTELLPLFSATELENIACPVLFIGGETDCFYNTTKTAKRLKKTVANVQNMILKNTGHVVVNQSKTIQQFIKQ